MYTLANMKNIDPAHVRAVKLRLWEGPIKPHYYEQLKAFLESTECQLRKARVYVQKMRNAIRKKVRQGRIHDAVHQAHRLYKTQGAALVAAADAITAEKRRRKNLERRGRARHFQSIPTFQALAAMIPDRSIDPYVTTWREAKRSGGYRKMTAFHLVDRARQHLVKLSFGALVSYDPSQAGVEKRSALDALALAESHARDPEHLWTCEMDLRDFYNSVPVATIAERYKLPARVVEEILTLEGKENRGKIRAKCSSAFQMQYGLSDIRERSTGRCLPTGSSISPIFAYGILQPALSRFRDQWGDRVGLANCNDNFLLFAGDRETLKTAINSLRALIREFAAFELTLVMKGHIRRIENGINFLGQRLKRSPGHEVRSISRENKVRLNKAVMDRLALLKNISPPGLASSFADTLKWLIAALSPYRKATGDYHRLLLRYAKLLQQFAARNRLRNDDWKRFAETVNRICSSFDERRANIWPGVKSKKPRVRPSGVPRDFCQSNVLNHLNARPPDPSALAGLISSIRSSFAIQYGEHSRQVLSISRHSAVAVRNPLHERAIR